MIATMVDYRERLNVAMTAAKMDTKELAKRLGVSYTAARKVVEGLSKTFSAENNAVAARELNVASDWLALGEGPKDRVQVIEVPALVPAPQNDEDTLMVPLLANSGSMGQGDDGLDGEVFTGDLPISRSWLQQRIRPSSLRALRFIHGYGDSMKGTYNDGDVLLVDTGIKDPTIDGVYVLEGHGRVFIKRVRQKYDGSFEISSDNPSIKTVDVLDGREELNVLGRVLWAWNGQKL